MLKFVWSVLIVFYSFNSTYTANRYSINDFHNSKLTDLSLAGIDQPLEFADSLSVRTNELFLDSVSARTSVTKVVNEALDPCLSDPIDPTAVDFYLTPQVLDFKHRELTCAIIFPNPNLTFTWDWGDGSNQVSILTVVQHTYGIINGNATITITLTVKNTAGCEIKKSKSVELISFIPNIFTPNGDGINDVFMKDNLITILDRSGTILYHGINGWDGTYKGKIVNRDTYFYLIELIDKDLKMHTHKGYITLEK